MYIFNDVIHFEVFFKHTNSQHTNTQHTYTDTKKNKTSNTSTTNLYPRKNKPLTFLPEI